MATNCSFLFDLPTYNAVSNELWIEEDFTSLFHQKYILSSEIWIGLVYLVICMLFAPCYVIFPYRRWYYKGYDMKQKLIKLRALNMEPLTKQSVKQSLAIHVQYQEDIMNIIFDFAEVTIDNVEDFVSCIFESPPKPNIKLKNIYNTWCLWICVMCAVTYFSIYVMVLHFNDSYRSFVDVPCVMAYSDTCSEEYFEKTAKYCIFEFDLNAICDQNTLFNKAHHSITVYGDLQLVYEPWRKRSWRRSGYPDSERYECGVQIDSQRKNINYRWLLSPTNTEYVKCCYTRRCNPFSGRYCVWCSTSCSKCNATFWDSNGCCYLCVAVSAILMVSCSIIQYIYRKRNDINTICRCRLTEPYVIRENLEETALLRISTR